MELPYFSISLCDWFLRYLRWKKIREIQDDSQVSLQKLYYVAIDIRMEL